MFGSKKPKSIAEYEAEGEIERVYHEIRQTLRVSGVNLNFRTWAHSQKFLPLVWDAMRPICETRSFEAVGDEIRSQTVSLALSFNRVQALAKSALGESQAWQARRALLLYHYINPKLLVFTCTLRRSLSDQSGAPESVGNVERIGLGVPQGMYPMEMVDEEPDDKQVEHVFADIKKTMSLKFINSDYRTLGLWPDYLEHAWAELKPIVETSGFDAGANELRELARNAAVKLPGAPDISSSRIEEAGIDLKEVLETIDQFEELLPRLILNIALLLAEAEPGIEQLGSPYPATALAAQGDRA